MIEILTNIHKKPIVKKYEGYTNTCFPSERKLVKIDKIRKKYCSNFYECHLVDPDDYPYDRDWIPFYKVDNKNIKFPIIKKTSEIVEV